MLPYQGVKAHKGSISLNAIKGLWECLPQETSVSSCRPQARVISPQNQDSQLCLAMATPFPCLESLTFFKGLLVGFFYNKILKKIA